MADLCESDTEPPGSLKEVKPSIYSQSRLTVIVNTNSTEIVSIVRSRIMFAFSSDERAFNIESYSCSPFAYVASRFPPPASARPSVKYHRTPVVEMGSKQCLQFSIVNSKFGNIPIRQVRGLLFDVVGEKRVEWGKRLLHRIALIGRIARIGKRLSLL
ncbi:hypothetical protein ANN_26627 [Periplaneta americana]|uniref:Uncharacterized protein n=1 Tax=Periplaneta americana TaxID=6978 RepID=A0ABQ8RYR9_PERAM|nr:hypothetical protein ANN_26627 [Periplaneta americana]